jgi:TonB family protein
MSRCLLIAVATLVACTSLCGQNSSPEANSTALEKASASLGERGMYVSGFEILNPVRNPNDLGFYPSRVLAGVRSNWYPQIPELQELIGSKRGITVIEFKIRKDGSPDKLEIVESAGDDSLDAAASKAISSSAPFARLPEAYHEKTLNLRIHFGYHQPASTDAPICDGPNWGAHPAAYVLHHVGDGVTPPIATYSPDPEYSEKARRDKYLSMVRIAGTVSPEGAFTDLCVAQAAGEGLDEKAMEAVRTWKFEPATLDGEPVSVRINVEATFRLY